MRGARTAVLIAAPLLLAALTGCGGGEPGNGGPSSPAAAEEGPPAHERFQNANTALLNVLTEASRAGADISEFQARLGPIVQTSISDMATAADDMETLVEDARAAFAPRDP